VNSERMSLAAVSESPKLSSSKTTESVFAFYCVCCRKAYCVQHDEHVGHFFFLYGCFQCGRVLGFMLALICLSVLL